MNFPEKYGYIKQKKIQIGDIDNELKNRLWNIISLKILTPIESWSILQSPEVDFRYEEIFISLWHDFFKVQIDTIPRDFNDVQSHFKKKYFQLKWFQIYGLLDFLIPILEIDTRLGVNDFIQNCNDDLEKEVSAYRFVGKSIAPITDTIEIGGIEESLKKSGELKIIGVKTHIKCALDKLSDRQNPDYRNSMKESISAVESLCKLITGDTQATLGGALKKIDEKIEINKSLKKGLEQIYGYTCNEGGIRHSLLGKPNVDLEDAKFMLVASCSFVNYLIVKAEKAGISFE